MMNEAFRRQPIDMEAMVRTQRNNKRTVVDMDRLDEDHAVSVADKIKELLK